MKTIAERIAEKMAHVTPKELKEPTKVDVLRTAKGAKTYVIHAEAYGNNQVQ